MNEEKSSIEILKEYASRTNRKIEYDEKIYPNTYQVIFHRRTLFIPNNESGSSYFVCFQDNREMGEYRQFSGVFIPIEVPVTLEARIRRKDVLDKLNPKTKKRSIHIDSSFDSKFILMGNDDARIKKLFFNFTVQQLIIKMFELEDVMFIGINNVNTDFVPGLKGTSNLGVYTTQKWILERDEIEKLFLTAEAMKRLL